MLLLLFEVGVGLRVINGIIVIYEKRVRGFSGKAVSRATCVLLNPQNCGQLYTRLPHWLMFLKKGPWRTEASTTWGVGCSWAWHRQQFWPQAQH